MVYHVINRGVGKNDLFYSDANFRILFVVEGSNVFVITVRHGARKRMTPDEVNERV